MNAKVNKKLTGFTLAEMIVVMAALAVIISLSFGDMTKMFDRQVEEQEKMDLQDIQKALEVYAEREKKLPTNTNLCDLEENLPSNSNIWTVELAKYSAITADKMCIDRWGNKRHYNVKEALQNFRGGNYSYKVYFASVLTGGQNQQKDTTDWVNITGGSGFVNYNPAVDDLIIKYTDNDYKLSLYEETLRRIDELEKALERYARSKRYSAISAGIEDYGNYIMYPKDARSLDPVGSSGYFEAGNVTDLDSNYEVETIGESISAVALTKVLGVPEYYGRNAVTNGPLWYVSNPGADRSKPCNGARGRAPFYPPAVIVTTNDAKPSGC